jgi:hypothetical protein
LTEPPKRGQTARSSERSRLILIAAYVSLAALIAYGVLRARANKAKVEQKAGFSERYESPGFRPPPDPLAPSFNARRVIRWCEALAVLRAKCQRCHDAPPKLGAPFPLLTYAHTQGEYPPGSGQAVHRRMLTMIRYRTMPPLALELDPPVEALDAREQDVILAWLEDGAFAYGGEDCERRR